MILRYLRALDEWNKNGTTRTKMPHVKFMFPDLFGASIWFSFLFIFIGSNSKQMRENKMSLMNKNDTLCSHDQTLIIREIKNNVSSDDDDGGGSDVIFCFFPIRVLFRFFYMDILVSLSLLSDLHDTEF